MSSTPVFPPEIEETIIDVFGDIKDYSSLKTCSLVCKAYLPTCRKRLFASVILNDVERGPHRLTSAVLDRLISARPEIADYIRKLDFDIRVEDLANPTIQESLKRISRLESLTVLHRNRPRLDWSNNPIRPALLHLLHLPTLTYFKISYVDNFVVSDLVPCTNLKHLYIGHHTGAADTASFPGTQPTRSARLHELTAGLAAPAAILELCKARRSDGQPVVDFNSLSKITVTVEKPLEGEVVQELFRHCEKLTDVNVSFFDPIDVRPSLVTILRPSMSTLKNITVNIHVNDNYEDPLFGIPAEFEDMHDANIIENITINILVQTDASCSVGDAWGKLDGVLTKAGWSALKRVSLAIDVACYSRVPGANELEAALRKLPETQFPRLSASESVGFDFSVTSTLV